MSYSCVTRFARYTISSDTEAIFKLVNKKSKAFSQMNNYGIREFVVLGWVVPAQSIIYHFVVAWETLQHFPHNSTVEFAKC